MRSETVLWLFLPASLACNDTSPSRTKQSENTLHSSRYAAQVDASLATDGAVRSGSDAVASARDEEPEMVRISAGSFLMGSDDEADERPVHRVQVASFEIDRTEVTAWQYNRCVRAGACVATDLAEFCTPSVPGKENHPATCLDVGRAEAYCAWAGKRLPSEEEWEYAARDGEVKRFPWGDEEPEGRACWKRSDERTCEVGAFPSGATKLGLLDMAGNVQEWTASGYARNYKAKRDETARVMRGGAFNCSRRECLRATARNAYALRFVASIAGVRCAR